METGAVLLTRTSATKPTLEVAVEVLLRGVGSVTPAAGVTLAVFAMDPLADPCTVPEIVMSTEPPFGRVGTEPATVFPETLIVLGQAAPPLEAVQLALTAV